MSSQIIFRASLLLSIALTLSTCAPSESAQDVVVDNINSKQKSSYPKKALRRIIESERVSHNITNHDIFASVSHILQGLDLSINQKSSMILSRDNQPPSPISASVEVPYVIIGRWLFATLNLIHRRMRWG